MLESLKPTFEEFLGRKINEHETTKSTVEEVRVKLEKVLKRDISKNEDVTIAIKEYESLKVV